MQCEELNLPVTELKKNCILILEEFKYYIILMITQGEAFMKYIEKTKNKYDEGFRQRKIETPVYNNSQRVYENTGISNAQSNSELLQSQNNYLTNYSNVFTKLTAKAEDYVNRISSSNPYLNKFIRFKNGTIVYVTNLGVAKPITSSETYQSLLGKNGCPVDVIDVPMDWSISYIEGSIIPLNPTLLVGTPMTPGESCGNEGKNVYVSSIVSTNASSSYLGCYKDSLPSNMTFIGDEPPMQTDASIANGDFSQPVIANNSYRYIKSSSDVPSWDFNAFLINTSDAWGYTKPYPLGNQGISIQNNQYVRQTIQISPGTYTMSFYSVGRNCCDGSGLSNPINIVIDSGTPDAGTIYNFQPPLDKWKMYSVPVTIYTGGKHSFSFEGTWTSGDRSSAIQGINLFSSGTPPSGSGKYTYDQCKTAAIDGGYQYFGLQYGNPSTGKGYCAVSNDSVSATKNGTSYAISGGIPIWASNTGKTGAGNTASLTIQGSLSILNSQGASIFSTPVANSTSNSDVNAPSGYLGCYRDTGQRALPNYLANKNETMDKCRKRTIEKGYSYFGLQYVNPNSLECWAGSNLQQAKKYGIATNCRKEKDGTMVGGSWSNAVYSVNPPTNYFLILQDDGNVCIYKGTGPSDNQGGIWYSMTNGKQQKPNPAFAASKGKFGKNYMKTGETLAMGDFIGSTDGSIYLLMQSDGNLVLYTSQSTENCLKSADGNTNVGGQGSTALYKMSEVGVPANLGKIGYIDKNSELYKYPDNKIGLTNNYVKYADSVSYGNDIPGALHSGGSLDQCKEKCNSLNECYGFEYHSSGKVCYPKNKNMYPAGPKQSNPNNGYDLYVREKKVKEGFETAEINSNRFQHYTNNNKMFTDSILDSASSQITSADKKKLSDMNTKITSLSQGIQRNHAKFNNKLTNVNKRNVLNTAFVKTYHDEYDTIQSKIKSSATNLSNINNMASDTNVLVVQQNSHYIMYAIIVIILLIITIKILS